MAIEFIHSVEVEGSLTVEGKIINTGGGDSGNWDTAYSWGNHADAGYVTTSGVTTEADPIYTGERDDLRFNKMVHSTLLFDELEDYNKPSGYSTMIQPTSHNNPLPSHGYYHIIGRRDGEGGYGALLQSYRSHELFHGITTKNTTEISWYNVWTSGDFAKQDVTEGATAHSWGNHADAGYISGSSPTFSGTVTVGQHLKATASNLSFSAGGNQILNIDLNGKIYPSKDNHTDLGFATDNFRFRHGNFSGTVTTPGGSSTSWNTAYGWGDHADAGYAKGTIPTDFVSAANGGAFSKEITAPSFIGKLMGASTGAPDATIWCVSGQYTSWGIFYDEGNPDKILFKSSGNTKASIALDNGNINTSGTLTASGYNSSNWDTAYNWGDHSKAGYGTSSFDGKYSSLSGIPTTFAPSSHDHDTRYLRKDVASTSVAMQTFETSLTENDDWENSPISIGERGNVSATQTADKYAPNLNFHWGGLVSNSLWMGTNGYLNWGSYSSKGIPAIDGVFKTGTLYAGAQSITATKVSNWNTAHGWGNHASAGYLTALPTHDHDGRYLRTHARLKDSLSKIASSGVYVWDVSHADDEPTGASDGLLTVKYWDSSSWATASFQDFHNRKLYITSKKNGTWLSTWAEVHTTDTFPATDVAKGVTAHGYGNHASQGYLTRSKPAKPSLSSKIVGETIEVIITASGTSNIDQYLVFSSIVGSDFGLIAVLSPDDFSSTMSVIDNNFDQGGKIEYRVYAVKQGVYSDVSTTSQTFSVGTLEPTNVSVISLNTAHYIQWDAPSSKSRFVKKYEVYHHEHDTEGSLSRGSATLIYSGLNTSFMRKETNTKFHQFWVEIDEA